LTRNDPLAAALRFVVGAFCGAFASIFVGLVFPAAGNALALTAAILACVGGCVAQIPTLYMKDWSERGAALVAAGLGIAVLCGLVYEANALRVGRNRCMACCAEAGYPEMIYAKAGRFEPRECWCADQLYSDDTELEKRTCRRRIHPLSVREATR